MIKRIFLACLLAVAYEASGRTLYPEIRTISGNSDDLLLTDLASDSTLMFKAVEVRCAMPSASRGRRSAAEWGLKWTSGHAVSLAFDFRNHVDGTDIPSATVSVVTPESVEPFSYIIDSGLDFSGGANTLCVEWDGGVMSVFAGNRRLSGVMSGATECPAGRCVLSASGRVDVTGAAVEMVEALPVPTWSVSDIESRLSASAAAPLEGMWIYMDRDTDPALALNGGAYRLALLADSCGGYDIVYMGGAVTNAGAWRQGMVKGRILPLGFDNHFGLEWTDAMLKPMEADCYAEALSADVISFNFPLYSASMRFRRLR